MQTKNIEDARSVMSAPHDVQEGRMVAGAVEAIMIAVPADDRHDAVAASMESTSQARGCALEICGWVSMIVNAANVVVMIIGCCQLNAYLNAPHPDDDAYSIAGVLYLILIPSLLDSALMVLFIVHILFLKHCCTPASADHVEGGGEHVCCSQYVYFIVVSVVLFLISCWPTGVGLALLLPQLWTPSKFELSDVCFIASLWTAVTLLFAVFAVQLCIQRRPRRCD
ncbi:hypothetical protein ABL78_3787 [Leptomonas seymouri]|uniref:Uncharacterized protein n=1 Tax=Leptomonas seymouri TaxID=5684 RepID=A0A0N1I4B5_LEPSE|nr:hypothetical protein ABL78_3787 [Leptomonas seymouri]|eukprot:KPI87134.1 hypothetical protein ABL78_3787 [Leptomonas seymouri]